MSDEKKKSTEEIIEEMQLLMERQMELQAQLLKTNWDSFGDALGAFMHMMSGNTGVNREEPKQESKDKEDDES